MVGLKKLVIGASGFLGSHVTRQLANRGDEVRVMIRTTSSTRGIDDLDVERFYGDIFDTKTLQKAMIGCDVVFYCVVDASPWLRDPTPMWRTNVDGLRSVLDVAASADLKRFVFTSSIGTIGIPTNGSATEDTQHNWTDLGGDYIHSRVVAEQMVLRYARDGRVPSVAMCVANTYGEGDWLPTPHGRLLANVIRGKMPFYIDGAAAEVVGIEDAARALVLAAENGRIGERYIISERFMATREINEVACAAVNVTPPRVKVPIRLMSVAGHIVAPIEHLRGRDTALTPVTIRLMHIMPRMDHRKAVDELGWRPRVTTDAIAEQARWFLDVRYATPRERPVKRDRTTDR
jgi:dihydroflavonol-4-reductase